MNDNVRKDKTMKVVKSQSRSAATWEKPSLRRVGDVGEIFQFPGGGKLSLIADDTGDSPRKPKGQE
jgi:hypothetical protein